jgi:hypothetical protein
MPKLAEITKKHAKAWKDIEKHSSIKPIETIYNGYRFRSRLEARWAVFFDALGVEYEYEPEGFELSDGTRYLPDFFLPGINGGVYVEVKGKMDDDGYRKVTLFWEQSKTPLYILGGIPTQAELDEDDIYGYVDRYKRCFEYGQDGGYYDWPFLFCVCPACGKIGIAFDGRGWRVCGSHHRNINLISNTYEDEKGNVHKLVHPEVKGWRSDDKGYSWNQDRLKEAYAKARQARFEHGEQPDQRAIGKLLPVGDYDYEVVNMERDRFKGSDKLSACPVAVLQIRCVNEQTSGIGLCRLYLNSKMIWHITEFFKSCGLIPADAPEGTEFSMRLFEQVVGRTGKVRVTITKNERDGSTYKSNSFRFIVPGK